MNSRVLLATNNAKKLVELRRIVAAYGLEVQVLGLADVDPYPEPAETETSFEGNALLKARAAAGHTGLVSLADDSGLCVDALNQMPGVRSSRWAGPQHDDAANLALVLRQLDDVPAPARGARFVAAMALVTADGREFTTHGEMPGYLTTAARGVGGFGYDPIFVATEQPGGGQLTNAELSASDKDAISHRGQAVRAMMPILAEVLA